LASKVFGFFLLLLAVRLILLVGMGVGKKELPGALLDFPPPPPIRDTGPFPLVLKFHKVVTSSLEPISSSNLLIRYLNYLNFGMLVLI